MIELAAIERTAELLGTVTAKAKRNAMSGQTRAVDMVLTEWGRWMRNADKVLGWQTVNVLGKVRIDGIDGAAQANAPTVIPDGIMAVDAAVAKLTNIGQKVMKIAYIRCPHLSSDSQRRRLNMSKSRWDYLLGEGRRTVAIHLGIPADQREF